MKPILFSIGPLDVSSYYFMGIIGLLGGFFFNYWETKRRNLDVKLSIYGAVWVSIFGYIGARAMHIV
ncbi:MAG TPA: prolipoprotein diacylglyceryl transferase, partial [bacterium]|nr:prolipoprotein diacylglyceryl transferase [bacterium]